MVCFSESLSGFCFLCISERFALLLAEEWWETNMPSSHLVTVVFINSKLYNKYKIHSFGPWDVVGKWWDLHEGQNIEYMSQMRPLDLGDPLYSEKSTEYLTTKREMSDWTMNYL